MHLSIKLKMTTNVLQHCLGFIKLFKALLERLQQTSGERFSYHQSMGSLEINMLIKERRII